MSPAVVSCSTTFSPAQCPLGPGDNFKCCIKGTGTIWAAVIVDGTMKTIALMDVFFVPELVKNLVSTVHIAKMGCSIHIDAVGC